MLLKILTLLKDEKLDHNLVIKIVERCRTEREFDEAIEPYIKSSPVDFKLKWANHGFAATRVSIWETLLKNYFNSSLENTLAGLLQISHTEIANNVEGTQKITREVAQDLASSGLTYGNNIHKAIQDSVNRAFMNNRPKYRKEFKVFQNDADINPAVIGESAEPLHRITDGMAALRNIPPAEVKVLLADLYATRYLYKFDTTLSSRTSYSMYESFLRAYFKHEMTTFNEEHKGQLQVKLTNHIENKYIKLDQIMEAVLTDFVLPGISKENIVEFEQIIFRTVGTNTVTSVAPVFGLKDLADLSQEGNFGTQKTFASTNTATNKFDIFIKGFIALSKLYQYLRKAGFTPYHIHADIFNFDFGDPSNKFLSLAEVVEYSSAYVQARYKYKLEKISPVDFDALQSANGGGLLLPRNYEDVILANRNSILLDNLTASVTNLTSSDADSCYATMHMVDTSQKANIFDVAKSISNEINPLYDVFQGDGYEWDNDDEEEVWDKLVIRDYFSYLLKCDAEGYESYDMDRQTFLELINKTEGDLRDLFDDLVNFDLDAQLKILLALESFVLEFREFMNAFNKKYEGSDVSEMEYSTFLYKHPMFEGLHDLVDASAYRTRDDNLVSKVILVLLQKYYPDLTLTKLQEFLHRDVKNISYSNFIDSVQARTFKDITSYFHYAKANLFNLSQYGIPIRLNSEDLTYVMTNPPAVVHMERFQAKHANIKQDRLGYLINDMGELYQVINENNKAGALHSSGLYIFTDRTAKAWS
ncbi:hypothetical protein [Lysinibacillus xylanilyticus]|uniref:hypothetical protein n=1 Tax=Lysinibacillus xylanilyticus TaxID=582475 RepID=UPI0036DB22F6